MNKKNKNACREERDEDRSLSRGPLPEEMSSRDQWVVWVLSKKGKKVPKSPKASFGAAVNSTDPSNWGSYAEARAALVQNPRLNGIGFIPTEDDDLCFLDFDDVVDPEAGEIIGQWAFDLMEKLSSFSYVTPSRTGFRIVIKGKLDNTGGDYIWTNPDTGEEHMLEVYDRKHFLTVTERILLQEPVREAQSFLDSLVKASHASPSTTRTLELPEVKLDGDLEKVRARVKRLFAKHDLPLSPITKGSRKITLLSRISTIFVNEDLNPDQLWKLVNDANRTMLYDENGNLEGLEAGEPEEVFEAVSKLNPRISSQTVQQKLDKLHRFMMLVIPRLKGQMTTDAKVVLAWIKHGRKHGTTRTSERVRVKVSKDILMRRARIKTKKTINSSLSRMQRKGGVEKGREPKARTNHYDLDLEKLMDPSFWGISDKDIQDSAAELMRKDPLSNGLGGVSSYYPTTTITWGSFTHKFDEEGLEEAVSSILHTTYHRGVGNAKVRYVVALVLLGGEAHNKEIAKAVGVKPTSTSVPLKELCEWGIVEKPSYGRYRLTKGFMERFQEFRSSRGEFDRDREVRRNITIKRLARHYELDLIEAARQGKNLDDVTVPDKLPEIMAIQAKGKVERAQERRYEKNHTGFEDLVDLVKKLNGREGTISETSETYSTTPWYLPQDNVESAKVEDQREGTR